ncbi:MAG: hypothetical protein IJX22_02555, partial [Opitutales bacterium]|nr:hypothetical protein [Opitutales bacterium]
SEGVRLKATRTYAEKTGELVSVSYNDEATPPETHTYNHLGQLTQTVDATGTRTIACNEWSEYCFRLSEGMVSFFCLL